MFKSWRDHFFFYANYACLNRLPLLSGCSVHHADLAFRIHTSDDRIVLASNTYLSCAEELAGLYELVEERSFVV